MCVGKSMKCSNVVCSVQVRREVADFKFFFTGKILSSNTVSPSKKTEGKRKRILENSI